LDKYWLNKSIIQQFLKQSVLWSLKRRKMTFATFFTDKKKCVTRYCDRAICLNDNNHNNKKKRLCDGYRIQLSNGLAYGGKPRPAQGVVRYPLPVIQ
jgi:hypothetical protein